MSTTINRPEGITNSAIIPSAHLPEPENESIEVPTPARLSDAESRALIYTDGDYASDWMQILSGMFDEIAEPERTSSPPVADNTSEKGNIADGEKQTAYRRNSPEKSAIENTPTIRDTGKLPERVVVRDDDTGEVLWKGVKTDGFDSKLQQCVDENDLSLRAVSDDGRYIKFFVPAAQQRETLAENARNRGC